MRLFFFLLMIFSEVIAASSQMLLKKSAMRQYKNVLLEYLNVYVIVGYLMLVASMVIAIVCYGGLGYMEVVVMEPINYILVMVFSRMFFNEKITKRKVIGAAFIIGGILVFNLMGGQ